MAFSIMTFEFSVTILISAAIRASFIATAARADTAASAAFRFITVDRNSKHPCRLSFFEKACRPHWPVCLK